MHMSGPYGPGALTFGDIPPKQFCNRRVCPCCNCLAWSLISSNFRQFRLFKLEFYSLINYNISTGLLVSVALHVQQGVHKINVFSSMHLIRDMTHLPYSILKVRHSQPAPAPLAQHHPLSLPVSPSNEFSRTYERPLSRWASQAGGQHY